jgi:hypothetical protein
MLPWSNFGRLGDSIGNMVGYLRACCLQGLESLAHEPTTSHKQQATVSVPFGSDHNHISSASGNSQSERRRCKGPRRQKGSLARFSLAPMGHARQRRENGRMQSAQSGTSASPRQRSSRVPRNDAYGFHEESPSRRHQGPAPERRYPSRGFPRTLTPPLITSRAPHLSVDSAPRKQRSQWRQPCRN